MSDTSHADNTDPMDELVRVSEDAGLYESTTPPADECPKHAGTGQQCWPSCGTGDRPAVTDAVNEVIAALTDKGRAPGYHDAVRRKHAAEWPVLHRALDTLEAAARTRPEPAVTDAMIQAMHDALVEDAGFDPNSDEDREIMLRAALEAAARAGQEQE